MKHLKDLILKYSLQNAIFYSGKANVGAVLGKVIAENSEARKNINELRKEVEEIVNQVNKLSLEQQKSELRRIAPELLEKEKKAEEGLPELPNAKVSKVVTRFAPSPTGPLSLAQFLRAVMLSYAYARKYKGKFIVRIEDTDAKKIEKKFYDWIKEDLRNLGIKWDSLVLQSDRLDLYYKHAEDLILRGKAYVCVCKDFKKFKDSKSECPCRKNTKDKNLELWKGMLRGKFEEGEAVLRLKLSMKDPNPVLRDPPLLRVNKHIHPLKGRKYKVWPLYNFACSIDDHSLGITHIFRGKEHEHNTSVQKRISSIFSWKFPEVVNFGMIRFPGEKIHTRDIKEWIEEGKVSGWDDPRLPTIRSLLRRGFHPKALQGYGIQLSLTKTDVTLDWEKLETINRKVIDPIANRYMVVIDPVRISIESSPEIREIFENLHPDFPKRGKKKIYVNSKAIYISKEDFEGFKQKIIRLKGLFNISLGRKPRYIGDDLIRDMPKIQWVSEPNINVKIVKPNGILEGLGEPEMNSLKVGELIQMERIGFGRIDSKNKNEITVYFAHK
jgi:glutamyl-tRNA synthetase